MVCVSQNWPQDRSYTGSSTAGSLLLLLILLHPSLPVLRLLWSSRTMTSSISSKSWRISTCSWTGSTTRSWSWRTRYRNHPCFSFHLSWLWGSWGSNRWGQAPLVQFGVQRKVGTILRQLLPPDRSSGQQQLWDLVSQQSRLLHFLTDNLGGFFLLLSITLLFFHWSGNLIAFNLFLNFQNSLPEWKSNTYHCNIVQPRCSDLIYSERKMHFSLRNCGFSPP